MKCRTVGELSSARNTAAISDTIGSPEIGRNVTFGKRPAAITARGFVLMRGGVPLTVDGRIVGAIGVSADVPEHDEQIAKAGVATLTR
jgi:uncharacterized protein GlcG (DUF336 family)